MTRIVVQDVGPFDAWIAYPTEAAEIGFAAGGFALAASRDAPLAAGARFPIVLFSHGSGRNAGNALLHRDLAITLAREGIIFVAPSHPDTRRPLEARPRQIREALEAMLADPRFASRADPARIGMIGFSFGGAVSLITAGAIPSLAGLANYCRDHADDPRACAGIPTDGSLANATGRRSPDALALKAIVLMEPYGALFDRAGLASVNLPVLIYRALQTDLRPEGNALALAGALPRPPQQLAVPGGHFVFVDPCPPRVADDAPGACRDAPGIDRDAIHQRLRREIAAFLHDNL
jgi:predicted dienelactone hydrolase